MKERITNTLGAVQDKLFPTREQAEAELAWDRERGRIAMQAVEHMPIGDVEILLGIPERKEIFLKELNPQKPDTA